MKKMKKLLSVFLMISMVLSMLIPGVSAADTLQPILYTDPIHVAEDCTLKAAAYAAGMCYGPTAEFNYQINSVEAPDVQPLSGRYKDKAEVTMTCAGETKVYYTTDGSAPTNQSTLYTQPFEVTANTTVKAIAYKADGSASSAVTTREYIITDDLVSDRVYVEVNGDDTKDGLSPANAVKTLARAKEIVRTLNDDMTGDIEVLVGEGRYYLDDAIVFSEADSATNGRQITYKSVDGIGKAELVGGQEITNWELTTEDDKTYGLNEALVGKVYKADLSKLNLDEFNALYVEGEAEDLGYDGEKAMMARTPNYQHDPFFPTQRGTYLRAGHNPSQDGKEWADRVVWTDGSFTEAEIASMKAAETRGEEVAQLYVWDGGSDWDWMTSTLPIHEINTETKTLRAVTPNPEDKTVYPIRAHYAIASNSRYYVQGNLAFLDIPGEYHYNKNTKTLYYYPGTGTMEGLTVIAPQTKEIFRFAGTDKPQIEDLGKAPDLTKQVCNITIDGFSMKDTEYTNNYSYGWNAEDKGYGFPACHLGYVAPYAAGSTEPSGYGDASERPEFQFGAITMVNSNHITVQNCSIHNTGMWGVALYRDNQYNKVENCDIGYTGHGAISTNGGFPGVGKYCGNHTFNNLRLHDSGQNIGHAGTVTVMSTSNSTFSHIDIRNTPRRALTVLGGWPRSMDTQYDSLRDCYTVGNLFEYINIYGAEQDAGEDSGVFFAMLMIDGKIREKYGTNAVTNESNTILKTGYQYYDIGKDKHNRINQMLIDGTGSAPAMSDYNSVHGLEFAMGAHCTEISNVKSVNAQSNTLALYHEAYGNNMDGVWFIDNVNQNYYGDGDYVSKFREEAMEYDEIGTTDDFPFAPEWTAAADAAPENLYFGDDFESGEISKKKWTVESGMPGLDVAHVAEGPNGEHFALKLAGGSGSKPATLSRTFENTLNKIVEVKFFDKYQDITYMDKWRGLPNALFRADDGENVIGIGADGNVGNKHYYYTVGGERHYTEVPRCFGWHTFKMDYSSGTDVKLYVDDTLVATLEAAGFNYVSMSSYTNNDRQGTFDQLWIYGGQDAPPAGDVPAPKPPVDDVAEFLYQEDFEDSASGFVPAHADRNTEISYVADPEDATNMVMHVKSPDDLIYLRGQGADWSNYTMTCRIYMKEWGAAGQSQPWDNMAPAWYVTTENFDHYSIKYKRADEAYAFYRRAGVDTDVKTAEAPKINDFNGEWHDYKIVMNGDLITAYVDCVKIFELEDQYLDRGTIGFDGINAEYYVDDICLTTKQTPPVEADKQSGSYEKAISITLSCENQDADIFYTLDGTDPKDPEHGIYFDADTPIVISESAALKAVAKVNGMRYSEVATYTYTINGVEPPAHTHTLTKVPAKAATCTEDGNKEYWICTDETCGKLFADDEGKTETTLAAATVPAEGHKLTHHEAKAPTETEDGNKEYWSCDNCGKLFADVNSETETTLKDVTIPATGKEEPGEKPEKPGWIIPGRPSKPSKPGHVDLPFDDVAKSDWFYDEVSYVYENGLMNGPRPGEFEPETAITRGMIVTILHRLEGEPMNNYVGLFSDVENYQWYTDAVEWAAKNDIVTGYTNGNFGPMDPVTREQLAAILYRYAEYCGYDVDGSTSLKSFNDDETISNYAVEPMEWAVKNGLINGSHNNLAPKANATRAQAAAVLMRFCEEVAK